MQLTRIATGQRSVNRKTLLKELNLSTKTTTAENLKDTKSILCTSEIRHHININILHDQTNSCIDSYFFRPFSSVLDRLSSKNFVRRKNDI